MTTLEWHRDIEERPCEVIHPGRPYCGFRHLWPGEIHYRLDGEAISKAVFENLKGTYEEIGRLTAFLKKHFPGAQLTNEGDIDCAIRLLGEALKDYDAMREFQRKFIAADSQCRHLKTKFDALMSKMGKWRCDLCHEFKEKTDFKGGIYTIDGKPITVCHDCYMKEFEE